MSAEGPEPRETNPLIRRVDALMRRSESAAREEVPVLTELVDPAAAAAPAPALNEEALTSDLERDLVARLAPELDRRLAVLRADLEQEMRRAVRDAVGSVLATRQDKPPSD